MNNPKLDLNYVFVYGTLKQNFPNAPYLADSIFLGNATIKGQLLNIGPFPGLIGTDEGKNRVSGEIYLVDNQTLARLDQLEGEGSLYLRKADIARMDNGKGHLENEGQNPKVVWAYFWNGSQEFPIVDSGYWGYVKRAKV